MVKNILNSSVSVLVLISFISSIHPSYAGNTGIGGEKDPEKKHNISVRKNQVESNNVNFQKSAQNLERRVLPILHETNPTNERILLTFDQRGINLRVEKNFVDLKGILTQKARNVLLHFDPFTTGKLKFVCKDWYTCISQYQNDLQESIKLYTSHNIRALSPAHLSGFLNSDTFFLMHRKLASVYVNDRQPTLISLIVNAYVSLIKRNETYHRYFIRMCVYFDPLKHSEEIELAHLVIKDSPNCQELISQIAQKSFFSIKKFSNLIEHSSQFPTLQRYLMAIKYLADSNHECAPTMQERQEKFSDVLENYFNSVMKKLKSSGIGILFGENSNFIQQPFWSVYANDELVIKQQLGILAKIADTPFVKKLNRKKVEAFFNYVKIYYPKIDDASDESDSYHVMMTSIASALPHTTSEALIPLYHDVNPNNLYEVFEDVIESLLVQKKYDQAICILENSKEITKMSPFRFQILFKIAECNLLSSKLGNIERATECISILLKEFHLQNTDMLDTLFGVSTSFPQVPSKKITQLHALAGSDPMSSSCSAEVTTLQTEGSLTPHISNDRLSILQKNQVDNLIIGLNLCKNDLENVKNAMKKFERGTIFYGECSAIILKILQVQFSPSLTLSKDLKKLLVQEAEKGFALSFFETELGKGLLANYGDVFENLLNEYFEWHALDGRKFKKMRKKALTSGK